ncbi:MAG: cytochrome c biogenesis protein CcsA [Anaerolineae bacterium]|nr:cytochrome c biogenesis protein CcsA [Anaerolineae bacterium]
MLAELGFLSLFFTGVACALGVGLALMGIAWRHAGAIAAARNALVATLPLLLVACGLLVYAQVNGHYEIVYVNNVSQDAQPLTLKVTALWGSQAGSLLFWSLTLSSFIVAALWLNWRSEYPLMPWLMVVCGVVLGFFVMLSNVYENPFERYWSMPDGSIEAALLQPEGAQLAYPYQSPVNGDEFFHTDTTTVFPWAPEARFDGRGLNPLLRHPGMIIHPPTLYLGFTGFTIPFAFALAALLSGRLGTGWMKATRRWSLVAWMFLSIGLILGGRWAYDVLGWGGYWGWDPVENSSLLPWLTGTAFFAQRHDSGTARDAEGLEHGDDRAHLFADALWHGGHTYWAAQQCAHLRAKPASNAHGPLSGFLHAGQRGFDPLAWVAGCLRKRPRPGKPV